MTNLYEILKNIILILFPFLCYTIYIAYCNDIDKKESNLVLSLTLFLSMYICYRGTINSIYPTLILNIPLIIAYMKNKKESILLMSILLIFIYYNTYNMSLTISIVEYLIYYIVLSHIYKGKNKYVFIGIFCLIKTISYILQIGLISNSLSFEHIIQVLIFIPSTILVVSLINASDNIINLNVSIKELEKELQLRQSLFNIAHEIKNPLAVCKGYLEMLDFKNRNHEKYIPIIENELNRSITLMNDMLSLNRIKINPDYMDINVLLEDIKMCIKPLIHGKNIKVNINISKEEIYIYADYTRLKHVFIDIIKNSIESLSKTSKEKVINIDVTLNKNKIITTIKDNGKSMTKQELKKLSDSYYIPNSKNKALGITLANEIIKCHNGEIEYKSKARKGNITRIILPAY